MDGDPGEPMLLQASMPLADMVGALKTVGWHPSDVTLSGEIISAVLPSRQTIDLRAPWPMTHLGRSALATLTMTGAVDQRYVLRIWASQTVIQAGPSSTPLLMVSLTADRLDPVAFGYAQLEEATVAAEQIAIERAAIVAALRQTGAGGIMELPAALVP